MIWNGSKMPNLRLLQTAEKWKDEKIHEKIPRKRTYFQNRNNNCFLFDFNGPHKEYFKELILKHNKIYSGTEAEFGFSVGEVKGNFLQRLGLITTIYKNPILKSANLWPITPTQSEFFLKEDMFINPKEGFEGLGMILCSMNQKNRSEQEIKKEYRTTQKKIKSEEEQAIYQSLKEHKQELGLSQSDLENELVIVNAGIEVDSDMEEGVRLIVLPGLTHVYQHEVLEKIWDRNLIFGGYGLEGGLPLIRQLGNGKRNISMPKENYDFFKLSELYRFSLFVLYRNGFDLNTDTNLGYYDCQIHFAQLGRSR